MFKNVKALLFVALFLVIPLQAEAATKRKKPFLATVGSVIAWPIKHPKEVALNTFDLATYPVRSILFVGSGVALGASVMEDRYLMMQYGDR